MTKATWCGAGVLFQLTVKEGGQYIMAVKVHMAVIMHGHSIRKLEDGIQP